MAKSDNGELNNSNLASNNSDPNNSLLQKVTKRVSGLFPSSISKWFGPSDGSTSVIRRRETEDDDEQLHIQQPPKKRAKPTATETEGFTTSNHFQMTSTPLINSRIQAGPSSYTRHTISTVLYDPVGPSTSTGGRGEPSLLNGDDKSDDSAESTNRGHGSNQPTSTMMMIMTSKDSSTPSPNKSLNSSRSLFSEQSLNPQRQCLNSRRPSFNSSTFGSPTFMDRTLSTRRAVNSPFYGGRTIYGGASAYKRNRIIFPRDEANNLQIKNSVSIKPVNDPAPNENACLSKTARRILDTLEHFSTPVLDAKKIPTINRQKTQRVAPYARDHTIKAPNRELIIPTVPDLLKMKQKERLQNSTEQVRKLATTSKSVLNEYSIRTLEDETTKPQKQTTKIKAKIATVREKKNLLSDIVDAVQLPEIKLPITNLPKFDFTLPPPPKPKLIPDKHENKVQEKSTIIAASTAPIIPQNKTQAIHVKEYKFAKPIVVKSDMPSIKAINHFKFSEPIDVKKAPVKDIPSFTFKADISSTAPRKKDAKNNGQQNNVGFALKPPEKLVEGSVMDILGKPDPIMDKFKPGLGTWECASCMVRNIPTATRCVACETLKEPVKKSEPKPAATANTSINNFGNQFKMSAEKWECGVCMVRNNTTDSKCVACTTPKPQSKSSAAVASVPDKPAASFLGGFGDKFKPASDTWACDACMVRNKTEAVKCVACETPKPGMAQETSKPTLIMKIAPAPASSGFSDFIQKQQTNWECPSCMVRNPPEKKTCVCCEAPKPGEKQEFSFGSSTTQFKFGNTGTGNTSGFSFGVKATPTTAANSTPTGFTFGVPKTESQEKNTAAIPTFSFGVAPATTTIAAAIAVVTTATAATASITPIATTTANNLLNGDPKKLFSFGTGNTTTTNNLLNGDPKKMFSFGTQSTTITSSTSSTTKASTTMFSPVVSLAKTAPPESSSTVSSTSPIPAPTITTTTTTVAPSPTFSFGTIPKSTNEEKKPSTPQFNFGSGSVPINPLFGSATNTTKTTNSFVQPTTSFLNATPSESSTKTAFNTTTFAFKPAATTSTTTSTNNNKTEVKPFSFTTTPTTTPKMDIPKGKFPEFTFNPLPATTTLATAPTAAAPLTKAPVMNFANSNDTPKTPQNNMFSFGAPKTENKTPSFGGGSMFGQQSQQTPQNGGFNFGATAVTPNFNFGAATPAAPTATAPTTNSTTPVFGFGSSQAGSGSATAATTPGVFTFGGGPPATAAFTPDIKPNFNFTGGTSITSFTGQGGPSAAMPQRKIRKAVRRTQPR